MRHTTPIAFALLSACATPSLCTAQNLAPAPIMNAYRFHTGEKLVYELISRTRNHAAPEQARDKQERIEISVESVDSSGNATLLIEGAAKLTQQEEENVHYVSMLSDMPVFRVTLDAHGRYRSGVVLKRGVEDSLFMESMKAPTFIGSRMQDSSRMKSALENFIPVLTNRSELHPGETWRDTVLEESHGTHYNLVSPSATPSNVPPPPRFYKEIQRKYTAQVESDTSSLTTTVEDKYEHFAGEVTKWHSLITDRRRLSDGLPLKRTLVWTDTKDGKNRFGTTTLTVVLVEHKR